MGVLQENLGLQGWSGGVMPSTDASLIPSNASPNGRNSVLGKPSAGAPYPEKRMGLRMRNADPVTGAGAILGMYGFNSLALDESFFLLMSDGRLDRLLDDDTTTNLSTGLTSGVRYPDFATGNDLCFVVNGVDRLKYDGTTISNIGIVRPTVGTLSATPGAAGTPNGTYELRVSFGNSSTRTESSASDTALATVTVTNQQLDWADVPVSSDAQVDRRFLYIRNIATQAQFYRAGTISDNVTTTATTNFVDANLVIVAPNTTENNPPPAGVRYLALYKGRLFAASDTAVYYSKVNAFEQFPPENVELVNDKSGQPITGLAPTDAVLLILKQDQVFGIFSGNNPATWEVARVDADYGCVSHRTIVSTHEWTYWWSRHGLVRWSGAGSVDAVGLRLYGAPMDRIDADNIGASSACFDEANQRVLVAVPSLGQDRATMILPFNTLLSVFESNEWDPMDVGALASVNDPTGFPAPHLGGMAGQVFRFEQTNRDGIPSGTTSGTFVASSDSITVFTDSGAAFLTTGGALVERKITILDSGGTLVSPITPRLHVMSNDATSVTMSQSLSGLTSGATYRYILGGPDFEWDTAWRTLGETWVKKRFEYLWLLSKGNTFGTIAQLALDFDYDESNGNGRRRTFATTAGTGVWDTATWDQSVWDTATVLTTRFRVARTGKSWRVVVRNREVDQPLAFMGIGVQAVTETTKR